MMSCADLLSPLGNRVLGHERHLRLRVARSLMAAYEESRDLIEVGETDRIFTNPRHKLTEDYITGRFG